MPCFCSVLIHLRGQNHVRVIVPFFEPTQDGPEADAIDVLKELCKVPPEEWVVRVGQEIDVADLEIL